MVENTEILIAGGGTWGSAAAANLARRGHDVLVVDRWQPPHANGSHSGRTRLARQSVHEGEGYVPLSLRTFELWSELESKHRAEVVKTVGALLIDRPDGSFHQRSKASLDAGGWSYEILDPAESARRHPAFRVADDEAAIWEPGAKIVLVEEALELLTAEAKQQGATFAYGEQLLEWSFSGDGVIARTDRREIHAERMLLTLGVYAPDLLGVTLPLRIERQILVSWAAAPVLADSPISIWTDSTLGDGSGAYGCPEPDGTYKFALHHLGAVGHPDELSKEVTAADIDAISDVLARRVPSVLDQRLVEAKTCMYTNSPDESWILDHHPGGAQVVVATGDSGRSFRYAPAIGEILADLAEDVERPDLDFLRADRFSGAAA